MTLLFIYIFGTNPSYRSFKEVKNICDSIERLWWFLNFDLDFVIVEDKLWNCIILHGLESPIATATIGQSRVL